MIEAYFATEKDEEKRRAAVEAGITLVEVPYWWKGDSDSLALTLLEAKADLPLPKLFHASSQPIPKAPPRSPRSSATKVATTL